MNRPITLALAGNPNTGKTTFFNRLTGLRQKIANYPGVTVEKKSGACAHRGRELEVVDLPGTYALTAYSTEELVARDFIIREKPDVVVNIVDASNLERNLYLTTQLIELGTPLVLAFNMSDVARARGIEFDIEALQALLGVPIIPTVGSTGEGVEAVLDAACEVASGARPLRLPPIHYGAEIEREIAALQDRLRGESAVPPGLPGPWMALKLLEGDAEVRRLILNPRIDEALAASVARIEAIYHDKPEIVIADRRYGFISGVCQETVRTTVEVRHNWSDRIDAILTHRVLGMAIFLGVMYGVFWLTFTLGAVPTAWIERFFGWAGAGVSGLWPEGSASALRSLIVDGIIGGVGSVIVFLPNILLLFLAIALLEDSGYMARAAFLTDHLMHRIGLHGKSIIPMLIGFGCSVPAILATRTLENRQDRLTTMLVQPLISCGARFPIYTLIIPAFFPPAWQAPILWLLYLVGIGLAVGAARVLRGTVLRGESMPFVMELPPYRAPTLKGLLLHMWEKGRYYVTKAGTVILGISIILWALTTYPRGAAPGRDYAAEENQAEADFLAHGPELARKMGVDDPAALDGFLQLELARRPPADAGDDRVRRLAEMRDHVEELRRSLLVAGDTANGRAAVLRSAIQTGLEHLERSDPAAYDAAIYYLDAMAAPLDAARRDLEAARRRDLLAYSFAGRIGRALEPALRQMGSDWRIGTALIGALAAKEVFVAQLGIVFSAGGTDAEAGVLRARLRENYTPLAAFCIMLFCLIGMPCVATVAATRAESGSWKWALVQFAGLTLAAFVITALVYRAGAWAGIGV